MQRCQYPNDCVHLRAGCKERGVSPLNSELEWLQGSRGTPPGGRPSQASISSIVAATRLSSSNDKSQRRRGLRRRAERRESLRPPPSAAAPGWAVPWTLGSLVGTRASASRSRSLAIDSNSSTVGDFADAFVSRALAAANAFRTSRRLMRPIIAASPTGPTGS